MAKSEPFAAFGKQVKRGCRHIADACDERHARWIVRVLNRDRLIQSRKGAHKQVNAGEARAAALTPERRSEIAKAAADKRWGERKA